MEAAAVELVETILETAAEAVLELEPPLPPIEPEPAAPVR